ncbi:MAG: hypothetical protein ACLTYW_04320 [Collinsella sp.]
MHDDIFNVDIPRRAWCARRHPGAAPVLAGTARYDEAAHNLAVIFEKPRRSMHLPESVKAAAHTAQYRRARHRGRGLLGLRTSFLSVQNHRGTGTFVVVCADTRVLCMTYRPFSG